METLELLIVFAALIAIVSVVAIALDWAGNPLRGKRFIARVYRFSDEMSPTRTPSGAAPAPAPVPAMAAPGPVPWAAPLGHGVTAGAGASPAEAPGVGDDQTPFSDSAFAPPATVARGVPRVEAEAVAATAAASANAFDRLTSGDPDGFDATGEVIVATGSTDSSLEWEPGMALDAAVGGRQPNESVKAERFWKAAARSSSATHFDREDRERMTSGKAPRRRNPRTGRVESMQLSGLREASTEDAVRMFWPGDAVDPWAPQ